ncbi:DDB1- and CUL4-associated factor 10 homolog isoform X2 [Drosophila miranda]|uniref:DDB1- and CUL4-associated factor 10 homolog isoform X2 n=1 Tax=Drosophila miranda TaxID=7229 RepID=UPI0007E65945|nr:DDB1- and CUL4-associated factor 10 homolog isoform X2 [Drosophila miranda]
MEQYLSRRESGFRSWGDENFVMRRVYTSMNMFNSYHANLRPDEAGRNTGAIFNLEFNADGNVLVAATERKCVLVFDAITQKEIVKVPDAHTDSVNCIKFFDDRLFATGSDDFTVALWDLRNMREKLRVLHGHSNWVKNIEYSSKDKLLVSSGFDGSIFTWDIASHTEQGLISQRVFHASGLMRCRISPTGDKLVLCTSGGYIMIIHHLDLTTLHKDLSGFRPGIYRLMQLGDQYIPQAAKYDHVFSRRQKKNRVELVTDFPEHNDAEMIMALQIHPHCRCMLTRNVSCDEQSEWTCIHDINEEAPTADAEIEEEVLERKLKRRHPSSTSGRAATVSETAPATAPEGSVSQDGPPTRSTRRIARGGLQVFRYNPTAGRGGSAANARHLHERRESFIPDIWAAEVTVQERATRQNRGREANNQAAAASQRQATASLPSSEDTNPERSSTSSGGSIGVTTNGTTVRVDIGRRLVPFVAMAPELNSNDHSIMVNAKKLLYYASETNTKPGFIKEPGFSADGRIICSPYGNGVRLLGYSADCCDYPSYKTFEEVKQSPRQLVELARITEHQDVVLCAKFSPREPLLVTGCNSGEVTWYRPNL